MSLGHKTLTGVLWQGLQVLANRAANLLSRLVLAWILVRADFGIVSNAIAVLAIAGVVSDFGAGRLLIRRKKRFEQWVGPAAAFTFASSLLTMAVMMAAAYPLGKWWFNSGPALASMIMVLALDLPLRALMVPARVGLAADLRFKEISRIQIIQGMVMVALSIALAVILPKEQKGWSMILPVPISSLLGVLLFWRAKPVFFWRKLRLGRIKHLLADSVGIAAYNIIAQFIYIGDNLALGHYRGDDIMGQYAMAYTLAVQMVNLVGNSLSMVLFPALASVKDDKPQLRAAWMKAMRILGFVAFPACLIQIPLADPVIRLVLSKAWEPAIPMVQALSFGVAIRAAGVLVEPLMFAAGRIQLMILIGLIQAMGVVVAATFGAKFFPENPGLAVAVGVAIAYTLFYSVALAFCASEIGLPWWRPLAVLAKPFICACVAVGAAWALALVPWPPLRVELHGANRDLGLLLEALAMFAVAVGLYFVLARTFMREDMADLLRRLKGAKGSPQAQVAAV